MLYKKTKPLRRSAKDLSLTRDRDGYVHTADGVLPGADYQRLADDNAWAKLPKLEDIPLMETPDYSCCRTK